MALDEAADSSRKQTAVSPRRHPTFEVKNLLVASGRLAERSRQVQAHATRVSVRFAKLNDEYARRFGG